MCSFDLSRGAVFFSRLNLPGENTDSHTDHGANDTIGWSHHRCSSYVTCCIQDSTGSAMASSVIIVQKLLVTPGRKLALARTRSSFVACCYRKPQWRSAINEQHASRRFPPSRPPENAEYTTFSRCCSDAPPSSIILLTKTKKESSVL